MMRTKLLAAAVAAATVTALAAAPDAVAATKTGCSSWSAVTSKVAIRSCVSGARSSGSNSVLSYKLYARNTGGTVALDDYFYFYVSKDNVHYSQVTARHTKYSLKHTSSSGALKFSDTGYGVSASYRYVSGTRFGTVYVPGSHSPQKRADAPRVRF